MRTHPSGLSVLPSASTDAAGGVESDGAVRSR